MSHGFILFQHPISLDRVLAIIRPCHQHSKVKRNSTKFSQYIYGLNLSSDPLSCSRSILLVLAVSWGNYDATITNVVPSAAEDACAGRGNGAERLVSLRVTEGNG
jgi:hypothetical protein